MRKTAAVCVAKLHDINAQLVEDQGFLDLLKELLSDSTPMVVANAVASLAEIDDVSPTGNQWDGKWEGVSYTVKTAHCMVPTILAKLSPFLRWWRPPLRTATLSTVRHYWSKGSGSR